MERLSLTPEQIINPKRINCSNCKYGKLFVTDDSDKWVWCEHPDKKFRWPYEYVTPQKFSPIKKADRNYDGLCVLYTPGLFKKIRDFFKKER